MHFNEKKELYLHAHDEINTASRDASFYLRTIDKIIGDDLTARHENGLQFYNAEYEKTVTYKNAVYFVIVNCLMKTSEQLKLVLLKKIVSTYEAIEEHKKMVDFVGEDMSEHLNKIDNLEIELRVYKFYAYYE